MADTRKPVVVLQNFYGGVATDEKLGVKYSHAYSRALDFRKKPSQMSVLPGARKISANTVKDLIQNIVQAPDGTRYAVGDQGFVYRISTSNVVTVLGNIDSGAHGMEYRADTDSVYIASAQTVSRIKTVSTAPNLQPAKYATSESTDSKASRKDGAQTYTVPTAIDESSVNKCEFLPDIEPFYSAKVEVVAKGTGDWTLTLHDAENTTLGSATVTSASLINGELAEFVVSTPVRMLVKPNARTYHFHLTSTVADGTIACATKDDLNTADFRIVATRLVNSSNGFHPIVNFQQYTCIGNERYLSAWEPLSDDPTNAEWQRHRLTFPPGYEVCGLASTDEFLVIACEKRSTNASKDFQDGKLFFWDGQATTYNFFIDVPEGSPQSVFTYQNLVYMIINGSLCVHTGGKNITKVRTLPNTDSEFSDASDDTIVYPNMLAVRRNILMIGYPSSTTNTSLEHGVYSWGSIDKNYPQVFGYNYTMSTATRTYDGVNALRVGCVRSFGDELYLSWRDDSKSFKYGLDIVDNNSDPASTASWESLIFDGGAVFKRKNALRFRIDTKTLPSGVTITPKYKLDRASSWSYGTEFTSGTSSITNLGNKAFREIQYGFDVACTGTTTPEILSVAFEFDPLTAADAFE